MFAQSPWLTKSCVSPFVSLCLACYLFWLSLRPGRNEERCLSYSYLDRFFHLATFYRFNMIDLFSSFSAVYILWMTFFFQCLTRAVDSLPQCCLMYLTGHNNPIKYWWQVLVFLTNVFLFVCLLICLFFLKSSKPNDLKLDLNSGKTVLLSYFDQRHAPVL